MSTHMLKSLSNREYDAYVNQRLSRLEQQADLFRSMLATADDPIRLADDTPNTNRSLRTTPQRPLRHGSQQHASFPVRRRPSAGDNSRRRRRMPSHENIAYMYPDHDQTNFWYDTAQQPRFRHRPRSFTMGYHYDNETEDSNGNDDDDGDDDDDSIMRRRAILTERNTIRNANAGRRLPGDSSDASPVKPILQHHPVPLADPYTQPAPAPAPAPAPPPPPSNAVAQQQQADDPIESNTTTPTMSSGTSASSTTIAGTASPPKKKSRGFWSLLFNSKRDDRPRDHTPSPNPSMSTPVSDHSGAGAGRAALGRRGTIRSVATTSGPVGDVLSQQQQDEIVQQLPKGITTPPNNENIMMVADLDRIWVFRATEQKSTAADVWTTFDFKNQELLTKYAEHLHHAKYPFDHGIELFDSHIRQGQLPVLVLPTRQQAYYPTSLSGDHIVSLQVHCLPNSSDLQFVYRQQHQQQQHQQQHPSSHQHPR